MDSGSKIAEEVKELDAWSERFIFEPLGTYLLPIFKKFNLKPISVTLLSLIFGIISAVCVLYGFLLFAALFYFISILLDNVDGRLARSLGVESQLRKTMDQLVDQAVFILIILSLSVSIKEATSLLLFLIILSLLYIYEVSFALRQVIQVEKNIGSTTIKETIEEYSKNIQYLRNPILNKLIYLHNKMLNLTSKYRTWPYPKLADIHLLLFLYTLFGNNIFLILMILAILPDLLISTILTILMSRC